MNNLENKAMKEARGQLHEVDSCLSRALYGLKAVKVAPDVIMEIKNAYRAAEIARDWCHACIAESE